MGELKQVISHYERALPIDPEHQDSLFFRGYCYLPKAEQGRDDDLELDKTARVKEAVSAFQKLICRLNQNTATQRLTTSICPARSMIQMLTMQRHWRTSKAVVLEISVNPMTITCLFNDSKVNAGLVSTVCCHSISLRESFGDKALCRWRQYVAETVFLSPSFSYPQWAISNFY